MSTEGEQLRGLFLVLLIMFFAITLHCEQSKIPFTEPFAKDSVDIAVLVGC